MENKLMPNDSIIEKMEYLLNVTSDYTRLKILYSLLDGEKCVSDIIILCDASQSLISHQLHVLKKANLVSSRKSSTKVFYSLNDEHVKKLIEVVYEHVMESK